ncbi:MAG: hypothetical protein ABSG57_11245 [Candidatus Bathyarchaeia archaeon]
MRCVDVTCYFRHLQRIFEKAGIEVTEANKREIDRVIHEIVGVKYKDCPSTWKELKKRVALDEESFVLELREKWSKHF